MLDFLINPKKNKKRPWWMFFVGLFYSSLGVLASLAVFRSHATLVMIFFTVLACMHFVYVIFSQEEKKDLVSRKKAILIKQHGPALSFLIFLFLGFTVSFSLWYLFLPPSIGQELFSAQIQAYNRINVTTNFLRGDTLWLIFFNNLRVLAITFIFAFFYGAGAIFIFAWNASVIGFAIGNIFRQKISNIAAGLGFAGVASYFTAYSASLGRYLTHGVFEILAYFMAALGASIISLAVIRHDYKDKNFSTVLMDSLDLLVLSILVLFFASLVEVYVTPVLF